MSKEDKKVRMIGPDGSIAMIPESKVQDAIKMGAKVEPKKESHPVAALAKSAISGAAGAIPDILSSIYNIPAQIVNFAKEHPEYYQGTEFAPMSPNQAELPMIPSATEAIEKGIENVIGETPEKYKHLSEGAKLAGSLAGPGGIAKAGLKLGQKAIPKTLGYVGSLKPSVLTGGALAGTTMSGLQEKGYSPAAQVAAGLGAGILPSAAAPLARTGLKALQRPLGLSPKRLNLKAAEAAKESGVELPASAFTDSKLMGLIDQYLGKIPRFGDKLRDKYLKGESQLLNRLNTIYEDVGPLKTEEIESKIGQLYENANKTLPPNAGVTPTHTIGAIDSILEKLSKSLSPSEDQAYVIKKLTAIKDGISQHSTNVPSDLTKAQLKYLKKHNINLSPEGTNKPGYPIDRLWETKKSLNDTINWEVKEPSYKDLLKKVQKGILEDIGEYGKTDPDWYNAFKNADELFGKVAKRKRLEHLLSEKPINAATGTYSYNSLSKIIHNPKTAREIKSLTSPETFHKIEKLGDVARTMSVKSANIPNPSGTAMVAGIGALATGLVTAPISTTIGVIGLEGLTRLITDQRFLDLAIKTAQGGKNAKDMLHLRQRVKNLTGMSINTINRKMNMKGTPQPEHSDNVRMVGPDGSIANIPSDKVDEALTMGAKPFE